MLNVKKNRKQKSLVKLIKLIKNSAVVFTLQVLFLEKPTTAALKCRRLLGQIQEVEQNSELDWEKYQYYKCVADFNVRNLPKGGCGVIVVVVVVVVDVVGSDVGFAAQILIICCLELIRIKSVYFDLKYRRVLVDKY